MTSRAKNNRNNKQQPAGAAARFREHIRKARPEEIVDATAPSGFTYKLARPSKFDMYFSKGKLPQLLSSIAVKKWQEDGVVELAENALDGADPWAMIEAAGEILEVVMQLSREPKLVPRDREPSGDNEISIREIPDDDITFLIQWCASGGVSTSAATGESTFPG